VKKAWGQPVDTGQIEQVTEKNILPETADNRVLEAKFLIYAFLALIFVIIRLKRRFEDECI